MVVANEGDHERALANLDEALAILEASHIEGGIGMAMLLTRIGHVHRGRGDAAAAFAAYRRALEISRRGGDLIGIAAGMEAIAGLAGRGGEAETAARLLAATERLRTEQSLPRPPYDQEDYGRDLGAVRAALPPETFAAAWDAGRAMAMDEAAQIALALEPPLAPVPAAAPKPTAKTDLRPFQSGDRGAAPPRRGAIEPGNRRSALHQPADRDGPRRQHPRQARRRHPRRRRRLRPVA